MEESHSSARRWLGDEPLDRDATVENAAQPSAPAVFAQLLDDGQGIEVAVLTEQGFSAGVDPANQAWRETRRSILFDRPRQFVDQFLDLSPFGWRQSFDPLDQGLGRHCITQASLQQMRDFVLRGRRRWPRPAAAWSRAAFRLNVRGGGEDLTPVSVSVNEVTASDRAGRSGSASRGLVLDTVAPQVTMQEPAEETITAATTISVSGSVVDASEVRVAAAVSGSTFAAQVSLGEGPEVTLSAVATDVVGHAGQASRTLVVDRVRPVVGITAPAPGAYLPGPVVQVSGTVQDSTSVLVHVNGQVADVDDAGTFVAQVPVADGPFTLEATARDAAGNVGSDQVGVHVDSVAPVIGVSEPPEGTVTGGAAVVVTGTVTDVSAVTLEVNGVPADVTAGAFAHEVSLGAEGPALSRCRSVSAGHLCFVLAR